MATQSNISAAEVNVSTEGNVSTSPVTVSKGTLPETSISPLTVSNTSFVSPPLNQLLNQITSIKMDRGNFLLWKNLALPILRNYKLFDYLTGAKKCPSKHLTEANASSSTKEETNDRLINPSYESWVAVDQLLLGWLYNSMTSDVATQVMGFQTSKDLWEVVQNLFGVQSRAEENYLKQVFQQTRKNALKMTDYLKIMKSHADNLTLAGSQISTRDLVSQVLTGLDEEYNPVVVLIQGRSNISWSELQVELLTYEKRLEYQHSLKSGVPINQTQVSANINFVDRRLGGNQRYYSTNFNTFRGNNFRGRGRGRWNNGGSKPVCQVCGRVGHT